MPISWGAKKQLTILAIFAAIIILAVIFLINYFTPAPSCFDNKQNQNEEGVDCGGAHCIPCSQKVHDITILWSRSFKVRDGVYDSAAYLENSNQFLETKKFDYVIKLFDNNNVLIAVKENTTFVDPGERFVLFEPGIQTLNREPAKTILEIRSISWEAAEASPVKIDVLRADRFLEGSTTVPRVEVSVKNQAPAAYKNIEATAVLWGANDEALGVSRTVMDNIDIGAEKKVICTWPNTVIGVEKTEILFRQLPLSSQ